MELNKAGREELALAIHLWKDFKSQGKMDIEIMKSALRFANELGIKKEFDNMHSKLPPFKDIFKKVI